MEFQSRLAALGLDLPPAPPAAANYIGWRRVGSQIWVAGVGPTRGREVICRGRVGTEVSEAMAEHAARLTVLNLLSHVHDALEGRMERLRRVVKVFALVNCGPDFKDPQRIVDAGSKLLVDLFGENGRHARAVTAAPSLPIGIAVEMDAVFEVE